MSEIMLWVGENERNSMKMCTLPDKRFGVFDWELT